MDGPMGVACPDLQDDLMNVLRDVDPRTCLVCTSTLLQIVFSNSKTSFSFFLKLCSF